MRNETKSHEDSAARIAPSVPWRLHAVYPLESYRLYVKFADGIEGFVDLSSLVKSEHAGVFSKLRNYELFQNVYLDYGAVTWPDGLDLAPDAMYDAIKAHGTWIVS